MKIPDSFISRTANAQAGPASLGQDDYSNDDIQEVEWMEDSHGDWSFYLVAFDDSDVGSVKIPLTFRQNGRPHSNVREDHSSKSVEPKARCAATAIPNQASEDRGRRRDWMASIPLRGMKVQSDSQRKLSQIA